MIEKKDALKVFNKLDRHRKPIPFSIRFVKANRLKKTGGQIVHIKRAVRLKYVKGVPKNALKVGTKRLSHHRKISVINLFDLDNEKIYKVHLSLITKVNDQTFYF